MGHAQGDCEHETIEVFVNFPVMDINRNVRRKDESRIPEESRERMDRFWGTGWKGGDIRGKRDLFGEERTVLKRQSAKDLGYRYQKRLLEIFKYARSPSSCETARTPLCTASFSRPQPDGQKDCRRDRREV